MKEGAAAVGPDKEVDMVSLTPEIAGRTKASHGRYLQKLRVPDIMRRHKSPKPNACVLVDDSLPVEVVLDFQENLKKNRLAEASQQFISREEQLFGAGPEGGQLAGEQEEDKLHKDFEELLLHVWMAIHNTFSTATPAGEHLLVLRSAVTSIEQQEQQDQRWEGCPEDRQVPVWRPQKCRSAHNILLRKTVESRLKNAAFDSLSGSVDSLSTSLKREVCRMGKCLRDDLLTVVRNVRDCYPPEFDILNLYAGLYQHTFAARLAELARSGLDVDDCTYLLFWVNEYYPNDILKHKELEGCIKTASLGFLLSQEDLNLLEDQYLADKEEKVKTWVSTALRKEEESWLSGTKPEMIDTYCFCPLAIDVIQAVDGAMREAKSILSSQRKVQRIVCQLDGFLIRFKNTLEDFRSRKHENAPFVMKANLVCIQQFREFVVKREDWMSEELRASCMSTVTALKDCVYGYFTCPIQEELKVQYRKVWTQAWLTGGGKVLDDLLESLDRHMTQFTDLKPACMEELLGRLHEQVLVEYVRRMMKRKTRLRDKVQQEAAASLLCDDSLKIHTYFTEGGSREGWLMEVLPKMAEVIRLQDPSIIQLEIVTLARDYPDLSGHHVSALLFLKSNLSAANVRAIKQSLEVNRPSVASTNSDPPFFSKVPVKSSNKFGMKP